MKVNIHPIITSVQFVSITLVAIGMLPLMALFHGIAFVVEYQILAFFILLLAPYWLYKFDIEFGKDARFLVSITMRWFALLSVLALIMTVIGFSEKLNLKLLLHWALLTPLVILALHKAELHLYLLFHTKVKPKERAIIVGVSHLSINLAKNLQQVDSGIDNIGFFDDRAQVRLPEKFAILGRINDVHQFVVSNHIDIVYITISITEQSRIHLLLDELRDTTVSIYYLPDVFVSDMIQSRFFTAGGIPMVSLCESPFIGINAIIKRCSDLVLSVLILLLISPLLLLIAIGIKLTSAGPVLFKQLRYGLGGEEIKVYKFRSMTVCENGAEVKQALRNDARVTPFGSFLRRSSLDELPQFFNVLQGTMSVVGPRPHAVAHNEFYRKQIKGYMIRHKVKPGITGWAQVNGCRGETETVNKMKARIEYDLDYLRHWSLSLDFWIILRTLLTVATDKNAY